MSKSEEFLNFWNYLVHDVAGDIDVPENVQAYIDALSGNEKKEKPLFTDNGKVILQWLQSAPDAYYKSKDIAEQVGLASKSVAGAMRKLITDGFVEKVGKDPVLYMITSKGKEINIEE